MHWHSPYAFLLFIPWFVLVLYYFYYGRKKKATFRLSLLENLQLKKTLKARLIESPAIFQFIALFLMIVALARPQMIDTHVKQNVKGVDIVIVLDISDSMLIEDMSPGNRIGAAKKVIKDFISGLVYDRISLIVFSGESYTRVPLTLDYGLVLKSLSKVQTSHYDPYLKKGTAIGVALVNAVARLRNSKAKSKVIVFLTDGEDNVGVITPHTALEIVKKYKIKVYTIGVGSQGKGLSKIPREIIDVFGRKKIVYQTLIAQMNEKLLKQIAKESGGQYFRADSQSALDDIFSRIGQLEKSSIEAIQQKRYKDLFPEFLKIASTFYFLSFIFSFILFWKLI